MRNTSKMQKYPKLTKQKDCAFPERDNCNYDDDPKSERCKYMKFNKSKTIHHQDRWECTYNKSIKGKKK